VVYGCDTAHHHLAIAVLFLVAGHMYRTNWGIGHSMKEILEAHKGPFTGEGHVGLYEKQLLGMLN
jgi:photosystem I P700 chlorophyll a apoprotein A1